MGSGSKQRLISWTRRGLTCPLTWVVLLSLGVAGVLSWSLELCWDSAYYAWMVVDTGNPFLPHGRVGAVLFQIPALLATRLTDDAMAASVVVVLGYALAPCLSFTLSWFTVRKRSPQLLLWPVLSICLFCLPVQSMLVAEVLLVAVLAWPLLLWSLNCRPRPGPDMVLQMALALFLCLLHPLASVPLALAGLALLARSWPNRSKWLLCASVALLAGAAVRMVAFRVPYETDVLTVDNLVKSFQVAVAGPPLVLLVCAASIAVVVLLMETTPIGARRIVRLGVTVAVVAILLVAGASIWEWSASPARWMNSIEYRWFAAILVAPAFLCAAVHRAFGRLRPGASPSGALGLVSVMCCVLWFTLLTIQGAGWRAEVEQFGQRVQNGAPCLEINDDTVGWSALRHWSATSLSLLLQGSRPVGVALPDKQCRDWDFTKGIPVTSWDVREWGEGRVDLSKIRETILHE